MRSNSVKELPKDSQNVTFTIGEVAKDLGLSSRTIRNYEY